MFCASEDLYNYIYEAIDVCDLLICDISENDESVMYGLGYADGLGKPVILICRNDRSIPLVIDSFRVIFYNRKHLVKQFRNNFKNILRATLDNPDHRKFSGIERQKVENKHIFICYSHKDETYLSRLLVHLKPLVKKNLIDYWVDKERIKLGDRWKSKIEKALRRSRAAILLISADFLASDFIVDNELPPLLRAAQNKGVKIMPIILKPCRFNRDKNLSSFQSIPEPERSIIKMEAAEQEETYNKISEVIESFI